VTDRTEEMAELFHSTYERLAPQYGYETRSGSAVPWGQVPAKNKALMVAVCDVVLAEVLAKIDKLDNTIENMIDIICDGYERGETLDARIARLLAAGKRVRRQVEAADELNKATGQCYLRGCVQFSERVDAARTAFRKAQEAAQ